MPTKVTPVCRYGHGNLMQMTGGEKYGEWGLIAKGNGNLIFCLQIYVCGTCGYSELFDKTPNDSVAQQTEFNTAGEKPEESA